MIQDLLQPSEMRMNDGNNRSGAIDQTREPPLRDSLSNVLFIIYVNMILKESIKREPACIDVRGLIT